MSVTGPSGNTGKSATASHALWSAVDAAAGPASLLIMLAALVRTLGAEDYGVLAIALATAGIAMAAIPAIATTTTKFVSEIAARDGSVQRALAGAITAALSSVLIVGVVLTGCTAIWRETIADWIFGETIQFSGRGNVLVLAMAAIALQQLDTVVGAAIRGLERFRIQALIELAMRWTLTATIILVAYQSGDLITILITQCCIYALFALIRVLVLRSLLPAGQLLGVATWVEVQSLLRYGGWMSLTAIAGVAYTNCDRILIGHFFGAAAAGEYSIYVQVTQMIHFIPSSLFAFSLPVFSRLEASDAPRSGIAKLYRTYIGAICAGAAGLTVALLAAWPLLAAYLAAGGISAGSPNAPIVVLALNFLLLSVHVAPYYLLLATGHSRSVSLTLSAWMGVSLLLMTVIVPSNGLVGAAATRLVYGFGALVLVAKARDVLRPAQF